MKGISPVRVLGQILAIILWLTFVHILNAVTNHYSTGEYLRAAQSTDAALRHQYETPLVDVLFKEDTCQEQGLFGIEWLGMTLASDLNIWIAGLFTGVYCVTALVYEGSVGVEHTIVISTVHSIFMAICQVVTLMPHSTGAQWCIDKNPTGVEGWPWYGVSFLTQSFAGGYACSDMLYSGHITHVIIFAANGAMFIKQPQSLFIYWVLQVLFGLLTCVFLAFCRVHYTVDIILGVGIATLMVTNPHLQRLAESLASFNRKLENGFCRLLGLSVPEDKGDKIREKRNARKTK